MTRFFRAFIILQSVLWNTFVHDSMCRKLYSCAILCHIKLYNIIPLLMKSISPNFFYTAASFAVLGGLVSCQSRQKPLNIVYIMTDDHTSQMMSCYDTRYIETPNLDRIAKDGVRYVDREVQS